MTAQKESADWLAVVSALVIVSRRIRDKMTS
jgi:hypothetical protein